MVEVNGQQSVDTGPRLWVWLICECNLYVKIYGNVLIFTENYFYLYMLTVSPFSHLFFVALGEPNPIHADRMARWCNLQLSSHIGLQHHRNINVTFLEPNK